MDESQVPPETVLPLKALLGYLNFSEGKPDGRFQSQLDQAYQYLAGQGEAEPWKKLHEALRARLVSLRAEAANPLGDLGQAEAVLALVFDRMLPAYRRHHADLLFHQGDRDLFQPFFLARVAEAVLVQGPPWTETERIVAGALARLNDFVGHRPVAILETRPQAEPYGHERVRPIPLYILGAGVAGGRYHDLVVRALDILSSTDPGLLSDASFDPVLLEELALDPRAYDHGHPANRRPNYVFGEWDPHHLDNQGRFRRYVVRQITLDALLDRVEQGGLDREDLLIEAAAVLAGTLLMATGVSGTAPTMHDSTTSLSTLMPRIARYRDAFYAGLLEKLPPAHGDRLRQEAARTRQPFGGVRQHLNHYLARQRAAQLQQRHLALLFARMGYAEAGRRQAALIPAASIRLLSEIFGRLTTGHWFLDQGDLAGAAQLLPEIEDLLQRGIACGALADPWNILGFQGLFPLSPAQEDAIRDPRIDELIQVVEQLFDLYAALLSAAAARGERPLVKALTPDFRRRAAWWDRFASVEIGDIRRLHGRETAAAAEAVAAALALWHERGEASADLAFWRQHLANFNSPRAFALVVDALLGEDDFRAALALLMSWLGQAEQVPLEDGEYSFHALALRWLLGRTTAGAADSWPLVQKFFDFLEANADDYWQVPQLESDAIEDGPDDDDDLYGAAYEDVTYRDSADDDQEGAIAEGGPALGEFSLEDEAERLGTRLRFLSAVAQLWQIGARAVADLLPAPEKAEPLAAWLAVAQANQHKLLTLVDAIHAHPIPEPLGSHDSLVEYDRRRVLKEQLLSTAIGTCLDTSLAIFSMRGVLEQSGIKALAAEPEAREPEWGPMALQLEQALLKGDPATARAVLPAFIREFHKEPLLFTALGDGGHPRQIIQVRLAQNILRALVANLPRLGLLRETYLLLKTAHAMEQAQRPPGRGVTEFNALFHTGFQAVVKTVVESASGWDPLQDQDRDLVALLEAVTGPFLALWVEHSQTLQLATLETLRGEDEWERLRGFVRQYGADLFHTKFLTLANLRGVLHRGVGAYLDYLHDNPDPLHPVRLVDDLDQAIPRAEVERFLEVILQAVIENYEEYKDYNTSTTQSDYGENLYVLLDFLLLKTSYERSAWQFRPLVMVHEVLARGERSGAALLWQEAFAQFSQEHAARHLERLGVVEQTHGLSLRTIRDRLEEKFVKALALDRLCALIPPAMEEAQKPEGGPSFDRLKQELQPHTDNPTGVGLDVPPWLRRLEMEVQRARVARKTLTHLAEDLFRVPRTTLTLDDLRQQFPEEDETPEETR